MINWRYLNVKHNNASATVVSVRTDRIDMREHVIDFGKQHVITKDTVQMSIDALVYFRVADPLLAVFKIQNLPDAVELLTKSTLRNIIATMTLDDTFSSREKINGELLGKISRDAERWGVTVTRVEIFNIDPPPDIRSTMENQIKAERERRSEVLKADGDRLSSIVKSRGEVAKIILHAEAKRSSDIIKSKGQAKAKVLLAEAQARCLQEMQAVVKHHGARAVDYLTSVQYLNALRSVCALRTKGHRDLVVLLPVETVDGVRDIIKMNLAQSARG
jgi:regulator of protease activity HflC (stomatin/prohibitin superfamily)